MKKIFFAAARAALLLSFAAPAFGALSGEAARVVDANSFTRRSFSSTEKMGMMMMVDNGSVSTGRIQFTFEITGPAPSGARVFSHTGNSAPAGVTGQVISTLDGVAVSRFYTTPGEYKLTATAQLDGQTLTATALFKVQDPKITLTLPFNGNQSVVSDPFIRFQWAGSGAEKYRVTVADNNTFQRQKTFIERETKADETFLEYRQDPQPAALEKLVPNTLYYWKVEGLNAAGQVISASNLPWSFGLKADSLPPAAGVDLGIGSLQKANLSAADHDANAKRGYVLAELVVRNSGRLSQSVKGAIALTVNGTKAAEAAAEDMPSEKYAGSVNENPVIAGPGFRSLYFKVPLGTTLQKDAPLFAVLTSAKDTTPSNNEAYGKLDIPAKSAVIVRNLSIACVQSMDIDANGGADRMIITLKNNGNNTEEYGIQVWEDDRIVEGSNLAGIVPLAGSAEVRVTADVSNVPGKASTKIRAKLVTKFTDSDPSDNDVTVEMPLGGQKCGPFPGYSTQTPSKSPVASPVSAKWAVTVSTAGNWLIGGGYPMNVSVGVACDPQGADLSGQTFKVELYADGTKLAHEKAEFQGPTVPAAPFQRTATAPDKSSFLLRADLTDQMGRVLGSGQQQVSAITSAQIHAEMQGSRDLDVVKPIKIDEQGVTIDNPTLPVTVGVRNRGLRAEESVEVSLRGWDPSASLKQTLTDLAANFNDPTEVTFQVPLTEAPQKGVTLTASVRNADGVDKDTSDNSQEETVTLPARPVRNLAVESVELGKQDLEAGTQRVNVQVKNRGNLKDNVAPVLTVKDGEAIPAVKGKGAADISPDKSEEFLYEMRLSTSPRTVTFIAGVGNPKDHDVDRTDNVKDLPNVRLPARSLKDLLIDLSADMGKLDVDNEVVPVVAYVFNGGQIKVNQKVTVGISTGGPALTQTLRAPRAKNDYAKVTFMVPQVYEEGVKPVVSLVSFPDDKAENNTATFSTPLPAAKRFDLSVTGFRGGSVSASPDAVKKYNDLQQKAKNLSDRLPALARQLISLSLAFGRSGSGSVTEETARHYGVSKGELEGALSAAREAANATSPEDMATYKCQVSVVDQYGRPPASGLKIQLTPEYREQGKQILGWGGDERTIDGTRPGDPVSVNVENGIASFSFSYKKSESWNVVMGAIGHFSRSLNALVFEIKDVQDADSKNNRLRIENPGKDAWSPGPAVVAKATGGAAPARASGAGSAAGVWTITEMEALNLEVTRGATVAEAVANAARNGSYRVRVGVKSPPKKGAARLARVRLYVDDALCSTCESTVEQDVWEKDFSLSRPMLDKTVGLRVEVEEIADPKNVLAKLKDTVVVPGLFTAEQYPVVRKAAALSVKGISVDTEALTPQSKTVPVTVVVENNGNSGRAEESVEVGLSAAAGGSALPPDPTGRTIASLGSKATTSLTFQLPASMDTKTVSITASLKDLAWDDGDNSKTLQTTLRGVKTDLAVDSVQPGDAATKDQNTFPVKVIVKNLGFPKETGATVRLSWGPERSQSLVKSWLEIPVDGQVPLTFEVPISTSAQSAVFTATVLDAAGADAEPDNNSKQTKKIDFPVVPYRDLAVLGLVDGKGNPIDAPVKEMIDKGEGAVVLYVGVKNNGNLPAPDDASLALTVGTMTAVPSAFTPKLGWFREIGGMAYKWSLSKTPETVTLKAVVTGGETAGAPTGNNTFEKQVTLPGRPWDLAIVKEISGYGTFDEKKQRMPLQIGVANNGPAREKDVPPPLLFVDKVAVAAVNSEPKTIEPGGTEYFDYEVALASTPKRMAFYIAVAGSPEGDANPKDNVMSWTSKPLSRPVRDLAIWGIGPGKQDLEKGTQGLKVWVQNHGNVTDTAVPPVLTMKGGEKVPLVKGPGKADIEPNGPMAEFLYEMRLSTYPRMVEFHVAVERAFDVNTANNVNAGASDFPARHIKDLTIDPQVKVGSLDKEEQTIPVEAVVRNRGELKVTGSVSVSISTAAGGQALVTESVRAPRTKDASAKVVFRVPQVFKEGIKPVISLVNYADDNPENNSVTSPTPLPVLDLSLTGFKGGAKTTEEREAENRYNSALKLRNDACQSVPGNIQFGIALSGDLSKFVWQDAYAQYGVDRYTLENCVRKWDALVKTPGRPEEETQTYSCQISVVDSDGKPAVDGVKVGARMKAATSWTGDRGGSRDVEDYIQQTSEVKNGVAKFGFSFKTHTVSRAEWYSGRSDVHFYASLKSLTFTILEGQDGNAGNNVHVEASPPMGDWSPGAKTSAAQTKPSGPRPVSAAAAGAWAVTELEAKNLQPDKKATGWGAFGNAFFGAQVAVKSPPNKGAAKLARVRLYVDGERCSSTLGLPATCEATVDQDGVWRKDISVPRPELDKTVRLKVQVEEIATDAVLATSEETVQVPGLFTPEEYVAYKRAQSLSVKAISANSARVAPESTSNVVTVVVENNGKSGRAETDVEVGLTATADGTALVPLVPTRTIASIEPKSAASVDFELPLLAKKTTADVTAALKKLSTDDGDNSKTQRGVALSAFRLLTVKKIKDGDETETSLPVIVSVKNEGTSRENNVKVTLSTGTKEIAPSKVIETIDPGKTVKVTLDVPLPAQDQLNASLKAALPDYKDARGTLVSKTETAHIPARIVRELAVKSIALGPYSSGNTVPVTVAVENRGTEKENDAAVTLSGYSGADKLTRTTGKIAKKAGGKAGEAAATFNVPLSSDTRKNVTLTAYVDKDGSGPGKEMVSLDKTGVTLPGTDADPCEGPDFAPENSLSITRTELTGGAPLKLLVHVKNKSQYPAKNVVLSFTDIDHSIVAMKATNPGLVTPVAQALIERWKSTTPKGTTLACLAPGDGVLVYPLEGFKRSPTGQNETFAFVAGLGQYTDDGLRMDSAGHNVEFSLPMSWDEQPAGPPAKLVFTKWPSDEVAQVALQGQPVVEVHDAKGKIVTSYKGNVTLGIRGGSGTGALTPAASLVQAVSDGVATFTGIIAEPAGKDYVLTATAGNLSAESHAFTVHADADAAALAAAARGPDASNRLDLLDADLRSVEVNVAFKADFTLYFGGMGKGNVWIGKNARIDTGSAEAKVSLRIKKGTGEPGAVLEGMQAYDSFEPVPTRYEGNYHAIFNDLKIDKEGMGFVLEVLVNGVVVGESKPFTVMGPAIAAKNAVDKFSKQTEIKIRFDYDVSVTRAENLKAIADALKNDICVAAQLPSDLCGQITVTPQAK